MNSAALPRDSRTQVLVWHWGRRGGGPRYTFNLTRALAADPTLSVHLSVSRQAELFPLFCSLDVPRLDVDTYGGRASAAFALPRLLAARARFGRYLLERRIDVVVCTMTHLWNVAMLGAIERAGARYLLTLHDGRLHDGEDFRLRRWLIERETLKADGVLTFSHHVRNELTALYGARGGRIDVIPLGLSDANTVDNRPRSFPRNRNLRLLFFGRLLPYKGLGLLLEAFAALRRTLPIELVIAGSGSAGPYAAALATTPGIRLENRWIHEGEVDALFHDADVVVLPYKEASQSGVIVHAFEHRVPVVVTPVGGLVEQVEHLKTGIVASAVSAVAVADALSLLVRSPVLYESCSHEIDSVIGSSAGWSRVGAAMADAIRRTCADC